MSTTPYAALYQVIAPVLGIEGYDHLRALERIESKHPGVRPQDIQIVIRAKSGAIRVPVGADGRVAIPATDALRAENPPVETNQPKGSLALIVNVALRTTDGLRVPWDDIRKGLDQARSFYAKTRGAAAPQISGIEVHFTPGAMAMLTIEGKGERLLMADAAGHIIVTRDLLEEATSPVLVFSRPADFILPYSDGTH